MLATSATAPACARPQHVAGRRAARALVAAAGPHRGRPCHPRAPVVRAQAAAVEQVGLLPSSVLAPRTRRQLAQLPSVLRLPTSQATVRGQEPPCFPTPTMGRVAQELAAAPDAAARSRLLLGYARAAEPFPEGERRDANRVMGCTAQVRCACCPPAAACLLLPALE